jgi:two-component system, sensor histidine kinase and response regulator
MQLREHPAHRVLVVDDNESNRALARNALEDEGYDVRCEADGAAALEAAVKWAPDVVLLDVRMPGMTGIEVCQRLRLLPATAEVPIVFLTALRDVETFDAAIASGGDDFLTKPIRPSELTIRVRSALELRKVRLELNSQVEVVRRQRNDLLRVQLQKERLSAFLVHDLKNPVNNLDLWAQHAMREPHISERTTKALRHIREESRSLTRMILNLLDISRGDEGVLRPCCERVNINKLLNEVREEMGMRAQAGGVRLHGESSLDDAYLDRDLIRRVIVNLVENAVRHVPQGGIVKVNARKDGDWTELSVCDNGPGIPPALRAKVFDAFAQLENSGSNRLTGRGLGLTFCRLVVEAHQGEIELGDSEWGGAAFVVRLPKRSALTHDH